jgi:hypothetical protein
MDSVSILHLCIFLIYCDFAKQLNGVYFLVYSLLMFDVVPVDFGTFQSFYKVAHNRVYMCELISHAVL